MKLLVLGGTKFLGRATVEAALARGHWVTLFNRGETNPGLFREAEKLRGDRTADRSGFGTATLLRHHFRRIIGVTPSDYRRRFSCSGPCEEAAATA